MGKIKIAMLGWEFPPYVSGGLGVHCYELTKSLSENCELILFIPKRGNQIKTNFKVVEISECNFNAYSFNEPKQDLFEQIKSYNENVIKMALCQDFDIIHCHDWLTTPAGIALKKNLGKPLVLTIHSTEHDRTIGNPWDFILNIEKKGIEEADKIITVSNYMKKQLVDLYKAEPKKINVIYNAIDQNKFNGKYENILGKKIVLYVGRLSIQKGVDYLLRAAQKVLEHNNDVVFLIAGKGPELKNLIQQSINLGISEFVKFLGFVPDDELIKLYSIADVFVMPSVTEPFGITALEAVSLNIPVIISKTSGVSEVLNHCIKTDFWDVNELANNINGILSYKGLQEEMGKNAKQEIKNITWENTAEKTLNVYKDLLKHDQNMHLFPSPSAN